MLVANRWNMTSWRLLNDSLLLTSCFDKQFDVVSVYLAVLVNVTLPVTVSDAAPWLTEAFVCSLSAA
jgi:hypothetical protein